MRKVEAPPPSRWPMMAMRQVIRATPTTLLPTFFISAPMILSNMPASVMTPKNRTEKMNRTAVPWTPLTPSLIKPAISSRVKAPVATRMAAVMVETLTNASAGTVTLRSSRTMTAITVAKPSRARIVSLMGLYFLSFFVYWGCILFCHPESFPFVMVPVYRLKLTAQSPSRYGLLRNSLISCKIPYGRLDTIKPVLRKKTKNNRPRGVSTPGPVIIFIYGAYIALRQSSHGEEKISR